MSYQLLPSVLQSVFLCFLPVDFSGFSVSLFISHSLLQFLQFLFNKKININNWLVHSIDSYKNSKGERLFGPANYHCFSWDRVFCGFFVVFPTSVPPRSLNNNALKPTDLTRACLLFRERPTCFFNKQEPLGEAASHSRDNE